MSTVETVLGPVDAKDLCFTLSYEHVIVAMGADTARRIAAGWDLRPDWPDIDPALRVRFATRAG